MDQITRQKKIINASIIGITVNALVAASKIVIGIAVSSIAIISEGINNATDASSSLLTLVGTKLSAKHPDKKHPFGYGRIEYLTSLVIAVLISYAGLSLLKDSVESLFKPSELAVTVFATAVVAVTAVIKFFLGVYTMKTGKAVDSSALVAVGLDSRNDAFISILTIVSSLCFIFFNISIDAFVGIVFSFVVLKSGFEIIRENASEIIGESGKEELARQIYKEVRSTDGIINAVDMMIHNYGPDAYAGSVNIEMDHTKTIGEAYEIIHALQIKIMNKYKIGMVFGIYAVGNDSAEIKTLTELVKQYLADNNHIVSYHALYISHDTNKIYCDFIVDYEFNQWDETRKTFTELIKQNYPEMDVVLTLETEFV